MKNLRTLALIAGLLTPLFATAQLIDTPITASPNAPFNQLVEDMAGTDGTSYISNHPLLVPEGSASTYNQMYFDTGTNTWTTGSNNFGSTDYMNFELMAINVPYFLLAGDGAIDIGFIAMENWDLDQLYANAYNATTLAGPNPDSELVFDYESGPRTGGIYPGDDVPPATRRISLADGVTSALIEFEHANLQQGSSDVQGNGFYFNIYRRVDLVGNDLVYANEYIMGIEDRTNPEDYDRDDGIFYLVGDIVPVPEPSQIAGLAVLGLGLGLLIRRRLVSRK